jgi:hypothetical protein
LYSAEVAASAIGAPHLLQNRESGGSSVPHEVNKEIAEFGCGVLQQPLRQTIVKASLMHAERRR